MQTQANTEQPRNPGAEHALHPDQMARHFPKVDDLNEQLAAMALDLADRAVQA